MTERKTIPAPVIEVLSTYPGIKTKGDIIHAPIDLHTLWVNGHEIYHGPYERLLRSAKRLKRALESTEGETNV